MTEPSSKDVSQEDTAAESALTTEDEIAQLRTLLFGPELEERLSKAQLRPEDVSRVLPEAVILRSIQADDQLAKSMVPTVEAAIQTSVNQDLNVLADSLFPVIGPATRKAVAAALKTLNQSLNQTLDHSLSLQSFKWRLEARQTGKTFAEVVLLRTLIYRVEQVFLIHRNTGILLQHLVADTVAAQDGDLVAAMLSAIQNFVQDSFDVQPGQELEALQFGELTIWIEPGPQALLVGVIRGNPPAELKSVLQTTTERVHRKFHHQLNAFQGDAAPFAQSREDLEDCLQAQYQPPREKPSPLIWVVLGSILLSLGVWGFFSFQSRQRWITYLEKLQAQPGVVVTTAERRSGKYLIMGLRDPLAADPVALMPESEIDPAQVDSHWEPYLSLAPELIKLRAQQLLQPPTTVSLKVDEAGILYATGSAPRQWTDAAQQLARSIPGVTQFQSQALTEAELQSIKVQIEQQVLQFNPGSSQLEPSQIRELQKLVPVIQQLNDAAQQLQKNMQIVIVGRATPQGAAAKNQILSQARADAVLSVLADQGLNRAKFKAVGAGSKKLPTQLSIEGEKLDRSVTFQVIITDAIDQNLPP